MLEGTLSQQITLFGAYLRGIETVRAPARLGPGPSFGAYLRGIETPGADGAQATGGPFGAYLRGIET